MICSVEDGLPLNICLQRIACPQLLLLCSKLFQLQRYRPEYAEKSLDYAKALFDFAQKNDKEVNADGPKDIILLQNGRMTTAGLRHGFTLQPG